MPGGKPLLRTPSAAALAFAAICVGLPSAGLAAPLKVFSAPACAHFIVAMGAEFERRGGQPVSVKQDAVSTLVQRINQGEPFDLAVLTPAALDRIAPRYLAGRSVEVARVGIGVVVRENAPRPEIGSVEAFKRSLRQAASIAYVDPAMGGASGMYFSHLLDRLGLADAVRAKAKLVQGGSVAQRVAAGDADIGIQMTNELVGVKGVTLVGPLPAPIQTYTVYAAVVGAKASDPATVRALLELLSGPQAAAALKAAGMERP